MTTDTSHDDTLAMLSDSLARYLEQHFGFAQRQRALAEAVDAPPAFWRGLSRELGLLGAALPEAQGGLGGGMAAHLAVMQTLGAALAGEPYLASLVIGAGLLQRQPGAFSDALLADVVAGRAVLAFAHAEPDSRNERAQVRTRLVGDGQGYEINGRKAVVHAAPWATHLIVSARGSGAVGDADGISLVVVERHAPGVQLRPYALRDGTRAAELRLEGVRVPAAALLGREGAALPQIEQALDEATLAVCAEALGVLGRLLADTLDYVRQRKQFGVAIASFQVVQHRLADMHMALAQADALTHAVLDAMDGPAPARARAVSSALVAVAQACKAVGQGAVQLHGGMGMTEELAVGHYFRRATLIATQFGPVSWHLRRVAGLEAAQA
ncbi:acyl-CoA dehydrogenase family protein [Acidovorax sp. Be4]|uniref:Acyl-CoA dehydrogenase family protein n=1 Tax=Acidovorax bellezanensis TaxID=2976702 RepID=A0ABT2PL06_9BURK|nr:acyl-CoA dehydrogenase family protein [Acidovorax sp. Be4]MCT9810903.1 acyl-CoA dehydrogenase family protein [Acidovorax sp. Be4]